MRITRLVAAAAAAVTLALAAPAVASATQVVLPPGVQGSGFVFQAQPSLCSCVSTIDGYMFSGFPYSSWTRDWLRSVGVNIPADAPTVVDLWFDLRAQPGYVPGTPITSISTTSTVSGTVGDDGSGQASPSSYGTG